MLSHDPAAFRVAHHRLSAVSLPRGPREDLEIEDPSRPETVQAMQIALNIPKQDPPARNEVLVAAARAVIAACLDDRAGRDTAYAEALAGWYGRRIRKVARRGRNAAWDNVQALPGVTVDNLARAFAPSAVSEVPHPIRKLQISGTDLPLEALSSAPADRPILYVDASLGMSAGKAAAQVGHGSMLLGAAMTLEEAEAWAARDFALSVREVGRVTFQRACAQPGAVIIRDAGYTEIAPGSATVCALRAPLHG